MTNEISVFNPLFLFLPNLQTPVCIYSLHTSLAHLSLDPPHLFKCLKTATWLMAVVLGSVAQEHFKFLGNTSLQSRSPASLPTFLLLCPYSSTFLKPQLMQSLLSKPYLNNSSPLRIPLPSNCRHTVGNESYQVHDWNKV